mgnify:CR=1 FL=1
MNGFAALDIPTCRRYVVDKAGAANTAPALKYKFYLIPHLGGYTEFGIVPLLALQTAVLLNIYSILIIA